MLYMRVRIYKIIVRRGIMRVTRPWGDLSIVMRLDITYPRIFLSWYVPIIIIEKHVNVSVAHEDNGILTTFVFHMLDNGIM